METIKKKGVRSVFTVKEKMFLTPHYIRIVFAMSDQQTELFKNVMIGDHNKIFLPVNGTNDIVFPDEHTTNKESLSPVRTYTTQYINYKEKELFVDFVAHGDNGPASGWAIKAKAGDSLGIAMKESSRTILRDADKYLLIGDSTAIPVIGAMLEQLPEGVEADVILEVFGAEDEMFLSSKANLSIKWVHNPYPEKGSNLAEIVRKRILPTGNRFVFAAAEFSIIKNLRNYFKQEQNWLSSEYSAISYWKKGESEDQSSIQRKEERQN
ncbi:siderophore-interacting protein [Flavobacterium sp. PS2]|uniref:siderophore-interacting protein n=1 Tax=Flavobacterium sp. PS2 TaxID=3384157 RepID=UPI00390C5D5C